jgi:hypothetical protein
MMNPEALPTGDLMEYQLWKAIVALLRSFGKPHKRRDDAFTDQDIVKIYSWAVIHDRPTSWALLKANWPLHCRRQRLPHDGTMSRRLRTPKVIALLDHLERRVLAPKEPGLFWMIDGKPLVISGCSKDRQAGYGRAAGCKAKGYKVHALVGSDGAVAQWRVAPMNKDERVMGERLVRSAPPQVIGYLVGDSNFDSNPLHQVCQEHGNLQLVTPRRYGPGKGTGHRKQTAGRLRSIAISESPFGAFGKQLQKDRAGIEREFGNWTNWGGGLTCLPPWVRTHRRVRRWVQAKLVLSKLRDDLKITTCAA